MYLHLGGDFSVRMQEIVSIHEYQSMRSSKDGQAFLSAHKESIHDVSGGSPKSAVVATDRIYLSALSPGALSHRSRTFGRLRRVLKTEV
ncbi:MAG: DUF370 domain-containing protein [Schwartzia sp.]|nr:DUF370 domain-containing protein [Schwartzia sp. (in: firmicutes)]